MRDIITYLKKLFTILIIDTNFEDKKEYEIINTFLGLQRLKIFSTAIIFLSGYYFYIDFVLFKDVKYQLFWITLISIHITCLTISIIFIMAYKYLKKIVGKSRIPRVVIRTHIFLGVFLGALTSINSQRLTQNIQIYIIVVFLMALAYQFEPRFMILTYVINQSFFLLGISFMNSDKYMKLSNEINSTMTVLAASVLSFCLYRYSITDFINKNRLKKSEYNFRKLFYINPLPIFIIRFDDGKILFANDRALDFYDASGEKFRSMKIEDIYVNKKEWIEVFEKVKRFGNFHNHIVEQILSSGQSIWVSANYELIDYYGYKAILCGTIDITQLKKIENELFVHASTDPLTGILNRRRGFQLIEDELLSLNHERCPLIICFVDINGLKKVNDNYGHKEGDYLINIICKIIKNAINEKDIFFRYGGDEFIVVFREKTLSRVEKICDNIKSEFDKLNSKKFKPYLIGASVGLYQYEVENNITVNEIIEKADKEMYKEKINKK